MVTLYYSKSGLIDEQSMILILILSHMLQVKEVLCPFRNVNVKVNSMPFRQEDLYIDEQPGEF